MNIDRTPGIFAALSYLGHDAPLPCIDVSKCRFPKKAKSRLRSLIAAIKMRFL